MEEESILALVRRSGKQIRQCTSYGFFGILDHLNEERDKTNTFFHNRHDMLEAFKEGRMYTPHLIETDEVYNRLGEISPFRVDALHELASFCVVDKHVKIEFIWTLHALRGCGYGTAFVQHFKVETVDSVLEDSV